ncbi:hypothetical protein FPZ11_05980 [Humibacter ginsenosidimutans]|uniref:Mannosyltransferase PIG-V n=2 Tax=Humibacter ginsenosidimutans TaxID=2599293 RepID=A0A5B8M998_9MICO|nr:hypothetical protein FPZ11_05980 [Humibacter ginsenosidimutans]
MMLVLASVQGANPWTGAHPDYFSFANIWDGRWYQIVAESGYPRTLPLGDDGTVQQNAWAFLPAYPVVVRFVMTITFLPWEVAAVFVSFAFGLAAALVFYRMMASRLAWSTSLFATVLFCVGPTSPMFQVAYAESMYLFLLMLALYLMMKRRYWWMLIPVVIMAFTRPSGLAFALAMGLHVVYRWFVRKRDGFSVRELVASITVTVVALVAGLAWPAIAGWVTGVPDAYTATELTWRADYIGRVHLVPFTPWFQGAQWWFGQFLQVSPWLGYITLVVVLALFAIWMFSPAVRRLGVDLRLWVVSYALYLLAVFFPQSSTFRILAPMAPLAGALAQPKSKAYRIGMVLLFLALQWGWLLICWGVDGYDWSPP